MSSTGTLQVHAYTSNARLPLKGVTISITASDGTLLALRQTDRSGRIQPVTLPVPERDTTLSPDPGQVPFTGIHLHAGLRGFEQVTARNIQLFADTVTDQPLELIPLSELPSQWNKAQYFDTAPQKL